MTENGPLPWPAVVELAVVLCQAIGSAHDKGIFHRDLKPSNVLVSSDFPRGSDIRLIDFGIAKYTQNQHATAQGATLVGTPFYMSPDQICGLTFDARSEVYCLGCVLFELLTGRRPFEGESIFETLAMHAQQVPDRVSTIVDVPEELDLLVARCLEKDPDRRFQSMNEVIKRLNAVEAKSGPQVADSQSSLVAAPRANAKMVMFALVSLIFVAGVVLWWYYAGSHQQERKVDYQADAQSAMRHGDLQKAKSLYTLAATDAEKQGNLHEQIVALIGLSNVQVKTGSTADAESSVMHAFKTLDEAKGLPKSDQISLQRPLVDRLLELANLKRDSRHYVDAERLYEVALSRNKEDVEDYTQRPRLLKDYGVLLKKLGRASDADNIRKETDEFFFQTNVGSDEDFVLKNLDIGRELHHKNQFAEAEKALEPACSRAAAAHCSKRIFNDVRFQLACTKVELNKLTEAEALFRAVLKDAVDAEEEMRVTLNLAGALMRQRQLAESAIVLERLLRLEQKHHRFSDEDRQMCKGSLFRCYWEQKKYGPAKEMIRSLEAESPSIHLSSIMGVMADIVRPQSLADSERLYRKGLSLQEQFAAQATPTERVWLHVGLVGNLIDQKKLAEARPLAMASLKLMKNESGKFAAPAERSAQLANSFLRLGMPAQCKSCLEMEETSLEKQPPGQDEHFAALLDEMVSNYNSLGMKSKSQKCAAKAARLREKHKPAS